MVQIVLNQAGRPPGVAGVAREDLVLATDVSASAVGGLYLSYLWSLIDKPVDVIAGVQSASVLTAATANTTHNTMTLLFIT